MSTARTVVLDCPGCGGPIEMPLARAVSDLTCSRCDRRLAAADGVLLTGAEADYDAFPDIGYGLLAEAEPRHFWFAARNRIIVGALADAIGPLAGRTLLDVGCGTGFVLAALERAGMTACGLDMHLAGLRVARERTQGQLLCETAERIPFRGQFDVVALTDVIEHADDDSGLLREAARALRPGGAVLVTVPADPKLWTPLDAASGHRRRYTRRTLRAALERAGLRPRLVRHFGIALYPVQLAQRLLFRGRATGSERDRRELFAETLRVPPAPLNRLLGVAMGLDGTLGRLGVPFGASLVAIASLEGGSV